MYEKVVQGTTTLRFNIEHNGRMIQDKSQSMDTKWVTK